MDYKKISNRAHNLDQAALRVKSAKAKKDRFARALILNLKLAKRYPGRGDAWIAVGRIFLHQKNFKKALAAYLEAFERLPRSEKHKAMNGIGNVYRYMADYEPHALQRCEKAEKFYKKAIRSTNGRSGLYLSNLSLVYARQMKWSDAIRVARRAITLIKREERSGIIYGNQTKILSYEISLYTEYKKRTL